MNSLGDKILQYLIEERNECSISEIARRLNYSKSSISETVSRLEKERYVEKIRRGGNVFVKLSDKVLRAGIIRASEYVLAMPFLKELEMKGFKVFIRSFNNGLQLAKALLRGEVIFAYLPVPTAYLTHLLNSQIQPLGYGFGGGAYILRSKEVKSEGIGKVVTTKFSTMELCLSGVKELQDHERVYASSGEEILAMLINGDVEYGVIWEPYATMAIQHGCKVYTSCSEVSVKLCCIPVVNLELIRYETLSTLREKYVKVMSDLDLKSIESELISKYSYIVNLDVRLLERTLDKYFIHYEHVNKFIQNIIDKLLNMYSFRLGFTVS